MRGLKVIGNVMYTRGYGTLLSCTRTNKRRKTGKQQANAKGNKITFITSHIWVFPSRNTPNDFVIVGPNFICKLNKIIDLTTHLILAAPVMQQQSMQHLLKEKKNAKHKTNMCTISLKFINAYLLFGEFNIICLQLTLYILYVAVMLSSYKDYKFFYLV